MAKQLIGALVVVVALLLAYVFLTEGEPEKPPGASWSLPEISHFDRIEIVRGGETLVVDKGSAGWRILQPLAFAAAERQMDQVEDLFANPDSRLVVDHEKPADETNLERYGLQGEDVIRVTLFDSGQSVVRFNVGDSEQTPSGATRTWIHPEGAQQIYRMNRDLRRVVDKDLVDWRNTDILVLSEEQQDALSEVIIEAGQSRIRLEKEGEQWRLSEPADIQVDSALVTRYVNQVDTIRAADFADEVDVATAGLEEATATVTLRLGDQEEYLLRFGREFTHQPAEGEDGPSEQRRYVQLGDGPIYQVRERTADQFLWSAGDFRPREVLSLDRDQIVRIATLDRDGSEMVLAKNDQSAEGEQDEEATWRMEEPEQIGAVDTAEFRRLLTNVADVEAQRFSDGMTPEQAGFDAPRRIITVTLADQTQHVIAIGGPIQVVPEGGSESEFDHYVRVDDGDIFELRAYKVNNLVKTPEDLRPDESPEASDIE